MTRDFALNELLFVLQGMLWTGLLSLAAFAGGGLLGLLVALARTSRSALLRGATIGYVQFFQGTPVLMQLFVAYYGLAILFNIRLPPWPAVILAFTLYAAAFLGEIWRGAIQSVPRTQWEAAEALALGWGRTMRLVILPQALRIAIPPTIGFVVQLIKGTSVAAIIGFVEVTRAGQLMVNVTFQPMRVYPIVALLYFALCFPLSLWSKRLETRLGARRGLAAEL